MEEEVENCEDHYNDSKFHYKGTYNVEIQKRIQAIHAAWSLMGSFWYSSTGRKPKQVVFRALIYEAGITIFTDWWLQTRPANFLFLSGG